nr:hypothetical protein CFP56_36189 [Quercus suber]
MVEIHLAPDAEVPTYSRHLICASIHGSSHDIAKDDRPDGTVPFRTNTHCNHLRLVYGLVHLLSSNPQVAFSARDRYIGFYLWPFARMTGSRAGRLPTRCGVEGISVFLSDKQMPITPEVVKTAASIRSREALSMRFDYGWDVNLPLGCDEPPGLRPIVSSLSKHAVADG